MKKRLLVLSMVSVFALTGCHGTKKVSFEDFKKEVSELKLEELKFKEVKVSGKLQDEKYKFSLELPESFTDEEQLMKVAANLSLKEMQVFELVMSYASPLTFTFAEVPETEYYVGKGFKVKSTGEEEGKIEWNKKGLVTSIKMEMKEAKAKADLDVAWKLGK